MREPTTLIVMRLYQYTDPRGGGGGGYQMKLHPPISTLNFCNPKFPLSTNFCPVKFPLCTIILLPTFHMLIHPTPGPGVLGSDVLG